MSRSRISHVPGLDGLRGAAVAGVLLFHAGHLQGGFLGVDLFFTLSGFLITSLLLAEWRAAGVVSLGGFWARRARRLLPAVIALVGAAGLYATVWASTSLRETIRADGLATLAYVANWHAIASSHGYFDQFRAPGPLDHTWSLAIEEQFYVLWPLLVVGVLALARRWGRQDGTGWLLGLTIALAGASTLESILLYHPGGDPNRVYLGSDTRAASILVGATLALVVSRRGSTRTVTGRVGLEAAAGIAVAGLAWAWIRIDGTRSHGIYEGGLTVCALGAALLIAAVSDPRRGPLARAFSIAPLRALGVISYGVYLWHWPVYLVLSVRRTGLDGWALTGVRIGATLAVAVASYYALERPIRRGAFGRWRAWAALPAGATAVVITLLATTMPVATVVASGTTATTATPANPATSANPANPATTVLPTTNPGGTARAPTPTAEPATVGQPLQGVRVVTPASPLRVLTVGDSLMFDAELGIQGALQATGRAEVELAGIPGFGLKQPYDWRKEWPRLLAESHAELVVTLWGGWDTPFYDGTSGSYRRLLDEAIGVLTSTGARVIMMGLPASQEPGNPDKQISRKVDEAFAAEALAHPGQIVYVESDPIIAPGHQPVLMLDGERIRKVDLAHFCPAGAARYGRAVVAMLAPLYHLTAAPDAAWRQGPWTTDPRYDYPKRSCIDLP